MPLSDKIVIELSKELCDKIDSQIMAGIRSYDNRCYCGTECEIRYDYGNAVNLRCPNCGLFIYRKKK